MVGTFIMKITKRFISNFFGSVLFVLFLASFIETFTYSGFLLKHFNVWVGIFFVGLVPLSFIIYRRFRDALWFSVAVTVLTILMTIGYFLASLLENILYTNYIFSHFHFHPELLLLSVIILAISLYWLKDGNQRVRLILNIVIILMVVQYLFNAKKIIENQSPLFILRNLGIGNDQKLEIVMGKTFYDYTNFIKQNTSNDSTILIPPQGFPWSQTGNIGYLRYFLFPRSLINGEEKTPNIDIKKVDYVLIDYGETTVSQYGYTNIWPKFDVNAEYIIYWNPADGSTRQVENTIYVYGSDAAAMRWGVIKIKK